MFKKSLNKLKKTLSLNKRVLFYILVLITYVYPQLFIHQAVAATIPDTISSEYTFSSHLPGSVIKEPSQIRYVLVTAYSSTPDQTDDTPFTTANGTEVRWGIAAANFLPFYTEIRMPEYFGDQVFVITDRMHPRFSNRIDIWFPTREEAKEFGVQRLKVEIWQ